MLGELYKISRGLGRGLGALGLAAFAQTTCADDYNTTTKNFVDQLIYRADQHTDQISSIMLNRDRITDSSDMNTIQNYYNQTRNAYVAQPIRDLLGKVNVVGALEAYISRAKGMFASSRNVSVEAQATLSNPSATAAEKAASREVLNLDNFKGCVADKLNVENLNNKKEQIGSSLAALVSSVDRPYTFQSMGYIAESRWKGAQTLRAGLGDFGGNHNLVAFVESCCTQAVEAGLNPDKCQSFKSQASNLQNDLAEQFNVGNGPMTFTPNPLEVQELAAQDLAEIIRVRHADLSAARVKPTDKYADEQEVFESMARCRIRATQFQDDKQPLSYQAAFAAAKAVKCSLFPAYAAQNLDTQWAKASVAGVAVPIQGNGWDINCSPNEAQAWNTIIDQTRDPKVWGLESMANPPYIQSLRAIPPVSTGLPSQGITADEYLMMTPTPGLDDFSVAANRARTGGRPVNAQSGPRIGTRNSSSRSGDTVFQNKVSRPGSGVARGQQLVSTVRTSSSKIRNNDRPALYANRMSLGAKSTRGFLETGTTRSKLFNRDTVNTTQTDGVRRMVLRSSGTRASRTTSEGILNSLNGRGTTTTPNRGTGSIEDIGAKNEAIRAEVKKTVTKYLANIETTRKKAEEARLEIMRLVGDYDTVSGEVALDIQNKAPKKIATRIQQGRAQQFELVKQLGVKRAEFDALQAKILEQSSALSRLTTFGPVGYETSIGGSTNRGTGTSRGSVRGTPGTTSVEDMPSGLDTSGRGTSRSAFNRQVEWVDQMWAMLNPISSAWAATRSAAADFEIFYAKEWKRFVTQYGQYVDGLRKADAANAREAAQLIAARKKSITLENYDVIDTETLTTIDMFLSELEAETEFLLEGSRSKQFTLSGEVINKLQEARQDTLKAQEAWAEAQAAAFKLAPKSYEQDPRVWYGFLPEILLQ